MTMNSIASTALLLLAVCAASPKTSADTSPSDLLSRTVILVPDADRGERVYRAHCVTCHGISAQGDGSQAIPSLAGQREPYLLYQLVQIVSLDRNSPEMHAVLREPQLNEPQAWRNIAAFLSTKPRIAAVQTGTGAGLRHGESIFKKACATCHGNRAEGSDTEAMPWLGGQHYSYLLAQLINFAQGNRDHAEPSIIDFSSGLTVQDQEGLADYLSRLPGH